MEKVTHPGHAADVGDVLFQVARIVRPCLDPKPGKLGGNVGHTNGKVSLASSVWFWLAQVTWPPRCGSTECCARHHLQNASRVCLTRLKEEDGVQPHPIRVEALDALDRDSRAEGKKSGVSALSGLAASVGESHLVTVSISVLSLVQFVLGRTLKGHKCAMSLTASVLARRVAHPHK